MKLSREITAFCLIGIFLFWMMLGAQGIQINEQCIDDCGLSLKSDFQSVLAGFSVAVLVVTYKADVPERLDDRIVRMWRRFIAFCIDMLVCFFGIFSIWACFIVAWNAALTGSISWDVELVRSAEVLVLNLFLALSSFWAMFSYFTWYKKRRGPTIGQYICGFVIVRDQDRPKRFWWYGTLVAYVAMWFIYVWVWFKSLREPKDGTYWWDRDAGTRAKTFF